MATFDYAGLRDTVDALLAEFGQDCQVRRAGAPVTVDPVNGTVTGGAAQVFPVIGVVVDYEEKMVDGKTIMRGDRQAYVQASVQPVRGDTFVEANGVQWAVVDVNPVNPAGLAVVNALQLRR